MKKIYTFSLCLFLFASVHAQLKVYVKFTPFDGNPKLLDENPTGGIHAGEIPLTTYSDGDTQTLNIGSQSTGSGAGRISFGATTFSKPPGANSALFFQMMASGRAFQFVRFNFYNASDLVVYSITLKLVAFKTIERAAASCSGDCPGLVENISMQYGGKVITSYALSQDGTPGKSNSDGWNGVRNQEDRDPDSFVGYK